MTPLVSAVIPTRNRPESVCRAVESALAQTYTNLEVIVVIDGPDPKTVEALEALQDLRLRIVALAENVGGSEARNIGVREAKGEWIAFLDDDDEWLPEKIEKQLEVAIHLQRNYVFIASQYIELSPLGKRVLPARKYDPDQPFSDFLFCRQGLFGGTGYVQTSTWLVSKGLALASPFTPGLKRNQDVDWMLHAMSKKGAHFELITEPLIIFNSTGQAGRVSKNADWEFQYDWAIRNKEYFTQKALAYFLSTVCMDDAVRQGAIASAFPRLFCRVLVHGHSVKCLFFLFYYMMVPDKIRQRLRLRIARLKHLV